MTIAEQKMQLRESIKERLSHMTEKDRQAESRSVCRRVLELMPKGPHVVAAYFPMPTEADIRPLLQELLNAGHELYLPAFLGKDFEYRRAHSLEELKAGPLRILEPPHENDLLSVSEATIVLLPGLAFDAKGHRLGRGNGGYDKWLKTLRMKNPEVTIWGVALECQIVRDVPVELHDETVDAVVMARGVL